MGCLVRPCCAIVLVLALGMAAAGVAGAQQNRQPAMAGAETGTGGFGAPLEGLDFEALSQFRLGRAVFRRKFTPAEEGIESFDGLGPLMNAGSCADCHVNDGRGSPPPPGGGEYGQASMLLKLTRGQGLHSVPDPVYGHQLQDRAIPGIAAEGRIRVDYTERVFTYSDGTALSLRAPKFSVENPAHGPLDPGTAVLARVAPPMFGLGLLAAIAEKDLAGRADPEDRDGDGISGRLRSVPSARSGRPATGRFGWKADKATLQDQVAAALAFDMGLSSPLGLSPYGDCTARQRDCLARPNGNSQKFEDLEVHAAPFSWLVHYSQNLAVPTPRPGAGDEGAAAMFENTGCAACHTPSYMLPSRALPGFSGDRTIQPYTDLLLHDLGQGLADPDPNPGRDTGVGPGEWRTPPLWAIGLAGAINGNTTFLHDGRARSIEEAILWHGGEAAGSRRAFAGLARRDRQRLLDFVEAL